MKILKRVGIVLLGLIVIGFIAFPILKKQTKKASPEARVEYKAGDADLSLFYCQPSKKDRVIFGELVPYGKVWRTGANENSWIETSKPLTFAEGTLENGKYSLWTIPNEDEWTVIFNDKQYGWGVSGGPTKAARQLKYDVLKVKGTVSELDEVVEMFTISFEPGDSTGHKMVMQWDKTRVEVPFE